MSETKKINGYPDPLAPTSEKIKDEYGLKYAKYIADQWFNGGMATGNCSYIERRDWVRERRLYARGLQDESRYKNHVARETEDLEFLNLDWRPTNWMGKFVRIITGGIHEDNYNTVVSAMDKLAGAEREKLKKSMYENMRSKKLLEDAKNLLGIDVTPKGFVPEDDEELKMMLDIKHRPKCEIAEEIMINYVFKTSNWHNTKAKVDRDLSEAGIGIVKVATDKRNGIVPKYVDPEFFIHSYVRENDFSDMKYCGHIEPTTIGNLQRNSGYDEKKLREIAKKYNTAENGSTFIQDIDTCAFDSILEMRVNVLHFTFETTKSLVYKKKKTKHGETFVRKDDTYNPPANRSDYGRVDSTYNTWMEGSFVIGTDCIYDYQEVENMLTDEQDNAMCDYIVRATDIYENKLNSFVSNVEPTLDEMHYTGLKLQHLIAEIRPNGANIDIDLLAELEGKVKGEKMSWKEILGLFQAKGITFSSRAALGEEGIKDGAAVQKIDNGIPNNLPHLVSIIQEQYNRVREITGINPFRDGTQGERALVRVQNAAIMASHDSTKPIVDASLDITKATGERISARLTEIFRSSHLKKMYERAVGKDNMEVVEALKDRSLHEFGFHIQLKATEDQIAQLREDLTLAIQEGTLTLEDKMEVEDLAQINMKLAKEYLKWARAKRIKEAREDEQIRAKAKSENDIAASQAASRAKVEEEYHKAQIRMREYSQKADVDVRKQHQLQNVEKPVREEQADLELTKEYIRANGALQKTKFVEEEKLKRQNKNNTDHSKMIDQRVKDSQPIDFSDENMTFKEMMENLR